MICHCSQSVGRYRLWFLALVGAAPLEAGEGPIDTLLVPGGWGLSGALQETALVSWIRQAAARSRRVASVCGGSLLLAEAGLLDGNNCPSGSTRWRRRPCRHRSVPPTNCADAWTPSSPNANSSTTNSSIVLAHTPSHANSL
ncbi:DJ-1/PfpI family protein [Streptomyces sp. NPDC001537]